MKKNLSLLAAMMVASGLSADPVDLAKATQVAARLSVDEPVLVAKAARTEAKARGLDSETAASSPYYVFSRGKGMGFVIVSGDDCLPEVLGYTESGDFDEAVLPPHLLSWLDHYKAVIENAQEAGQNISRKSPDCKYAPRRAKGWDNIPALLTTHWHQTAPYNDRCPYIPGKTSRALTGCVATAAAQVIYYYRKDNPTTFPAATPTYAADQWHRIAVTDQIAKGTPIKWDLMLDKYGGGEPAEFRQAVADLVFAVGAMDHMNYGESSAAQITDLVAPMEKYFNLLSQNEYKSDGTSSWIDLATWEKRIYDDLAKGHPIIYTGYHADNGGHSVVLDGYQSTTGLFHFNFGWGGQGDGWYTVDDETGMNYFRMRQGMTYNVRPKKQNLSASIDMSDGFYLNHTNTVRVKMRNLGTLNYQGIYLFCTSGGSKPTSLSSAASKDIETVLANDGAEVELTLTARPSLTRTYNIYVTDANLNIIAQTAAEAVAAESDLRLERLDVAGSSDTEELEGKDYQVVYNDKTTAYATLHNGISIPYEGTLRMAFSVYDTETSQWTEVGYKTSKATIAGETTGKAEFSVQSTSTCPFEKDKFYCGVLVNPVPNSDDVIKYAEDVDTVVRFIFKDGDMEVVSFDNNCLALKGHFDVTAFNSTMFAKKAAYKTATTYDLTQCTAIETIEQDVNPNALCYVADDSHAKGANIVKAVKCSSLVLTPGHDFTPRADFLAEKASLRIGNETGKWHLLTSPFAATVPDGVIAREITSHNSAGISSKTIDVKTLEAGKTYLVMASSHGNMLLEGESVTVKAAPTDNLDAAVVGTYVGTGTPANAQLLNDEESQYFVPVEEGTAVEALRGYWCAEDLTSKFRAYSNITTDAAYLVLANSIQEAYDILDRYKNLVSAEAYDRYLEEIHQAESNFSNRTNTELTTAQKVKTYAAELLTDGDEYMRQLKNVQNVEIDFTGNIVNPSFETKTTKGWTLSKMEGHTAVGNVIDGTTVTTNRSVGLDGTYLFRSLVATADSSSVSISQLVEGLKPGYYRLNAKVGTDPAHTVTMFAGDSTVTVQGSAFGQFYLTDAEIDRIEVKADEASATGSLNIGIAAGKWYKADDFRLTFVGSLEGDLPDAIVDTETESSRTRKGIYTLQGVKINQVTQPGFYIVDGKKYVYK